MTIHKFTNWGRVIPRPEIVEACGSDRAAIRFINHCQQTGAVIPHIHLTGGGLACSLGESQPLSNTEALELPIDLLHVSFRTTDSIEHTASAINSVVLRHRWWTRRVIAITNGGYLGSREIVPRAHPNDGVFDLLEISADMSYRQRLIARSRIRFGTHIPHPSISYRQSRSDQWIFTPPIRLYLDEVYAGRITRIYVTIAPDALKLVV